MEVIRDCTQRDASYMIGFGKYDDNPIYIDEAEMRELRDKFDEILGD